MEVDEVMSMMQLESWNNVWTQHS